LLAEEQSAQAGKGGTVHFQRPSAAVHQMAEYEASCDAWILRADCDDYQNESVRNRLRRPGGVAMPRTSAIRRNCAGQLGQ